MICSSECRRLVVAIVLVILLMTIVGIFIFEVLTNDSDSALSITSHRKYYADRCKYTYNAKSGNWECVKETNSSSGLPAFLVWLALPFLLTLRRLICKTSHEASPARQEFLMLERPVVALSTVGTYENISGSTTSPSAPPHTIVLPPIQITVSSMEQNAPPPEYSPPPAYDECTKNMSNYN